VRVIQRVPSWQLSATIGTYAFGVLSQQRKAVHAVVFEEIREFVQSLADGDNRQRPFGGPARLDVQDLRVYSESGPAELTELGLVLVDADDPDTVFREQSNWWRSFANGSGSRRPSSGLPRRNRLLGVG
jgi:hypothetical protein